MCPSSGWSHVSGTVLRGKVLLPGRPLTRTACRFGKFLCASLFRCACCGFWAQHYFGGATDALWVDKEANPLLRNRVFSSWENPNIFAGYLCIVAAYVMGYISVEKNSRKRWGLFGILLLVILCEVFTFSRGFWVAMAAEVLAFVLFFYRRGILYLFGVALAGAALAGPAVWQRLNTLRHVTEDSSAAMRLAYLEIANCPGGCGGASAGDRLVQLPLCFSGIRFLF